MVCHPKPSCLKNVHPRMTSMEVPNFSSVFIYYNEESLCLSKGNALLFITWGTWLCQYQYKWFKDGRTEVGFTAVLPSIKYWMVNCQEQPLCLPSQDIGIHIVYVIHFTYVILVSEAYLPAGPGRLVCGNHSSSYILLWVRIYFITAVLPLLV